MKLFLLPALQAAVLLGCGIPTESDPVKVSITGSYVRSSHDEFGSSHDTIMIDLQNEGANQYRLTHKWRYTRVLDGRPLPTSYKKATTTAIYKAAAPLLEGSQTGVIYSIDAKKGFLFAGSTTYQKQK